MGTSWWWPMGWLAVLAAAGSAAVVHVGTGGDDANDGLTAATAVRSLGAALARLEPGGTCLVGDGVWYLDETIVFGPAHSGSAAAPTTLAAAPGARPRLVAGRRVTGWEPWRGEIMRCDLRPLGLGETVFRELYCDGQRQVTARYPNRPADAPATSGWLHIEAPAEPGSKRAFVAYAGDLRPEAELAGGELVQFHNVNYYNTIVGIEAFDPASRTVTLDRDVHSAITGGGAERYYVQNLLGELDAPGEWYHDRAAGQLYFWPPKPLADAVVEVPTLDFAIHVREGAEHITVRGLTIEVARRAGIQCAGAAHCRFEGNTVRHIGVGTQIGGWSTWEDCCGIGLYGGRENLAIGNQISQVGGHGVKLTGGEWQTLTPGGNTAEGNWIDRTGLDWKQGCGARLSGVGQRFARNEVHDTPRFAVIYGGWDHVIELNHLHRLNQETCDTGAIYSGGRDGVTPWGCVIRHNYIHDIGGYGRHDGRWTSPYYSWGIYLDDHSNGVEVFGNIVIGGARGGVHSHNGSHNTIENNILIGGLGQQIEFNGWDPEGATWQSRLPDAMRNWEARRGLPAWERFPRLMATPPTEWGMMTGNVVRRNILVATEPGSAIYRYRRLPLAETVFESNLLWAGGAAIRTGVGASVVRAAAGAPELAPDFGFEAVPPGQTPPGWGWYARPSAAASAVGDASQAQTGSQSLRLTCAPPADAGAQFKHLMVKTHNIAIEPGKSYRIAAWFRGDRPDLPVNLVAQSWRQGQHSWAREVARRVGEEWQLVELGIVIPGPGEAGHIPTMTDFYVRIDVRAPEGTIWIDDVSVREAEVVDEWEAWRQLGLDVDSVIADPLFVDPANGDYRLRPESPAWALGFQPIPVDQIGPGPRPAG